MKSKKIFLVSTLCLLGAAAFSVTALNSGDLLNSVLGTNGTQLWNHYDAVAPTFDSNGIKEYWVSCSDPAHTIQYIAPTGDVEITDKGQPSVEFINGLDVGDGRLLPRLPRTFSFEDGQIPSYLSITGGTASVASDEATHGSKSLQIVNGFHLAISRDWLNAVFTTESADTVWFDIKASTRAPDLYYNSITNQWGVIRYEPESNYAGVQTYWHTVAFTKAMFADLKADNTVIRVDNANGVTFHIDNIRFGRDDGTESFEHAIIKSATPDSDNNYSIFDATNGSTRVLMANSAGITNFELTDAKATDGTSSVHIVTAPNSNLQVYAPYSLYERAQAAGADIMFDAYHTGITDAFHMYAYDHMEPHSWVNADNNNKWTTHIIPLAYIETVGTSYTRIIGTPSTGTFDVYIDNIRLANEDDIIGFEEGNADGEGYQILADTRNIHTVTDEIAYRSSYSLKVEVTSENNMTFRISSAMYDRIPENGYLSFYAYTSQAFNGPVWHLYGEDLNVWTHIKVAKSQLTYHTGAYYVGTTWAATTFYLDDIRILGPDPVVEAVNPNIMAEPVDATWYA